VKAILLLCVLAATLSGCVPRKDGVAPTSERSVDMHTSQNSLDWAGAYTGVLPCADCPGINTRLTLKRDGGFELTTQYLERQPAPATVRGQFTWAASGNAITLDATGGGQQYAVGEGRLTQLNRDGSSAGTESSNRVLTLESPAVSLVRMLEDHRWTLESASDGQGRRLEALSPAGARPAVFSFSEARLSIQASCNRLFGSYEISPQGQLKLGRMGSTMMACAPALMQADTALAALLAQPLTVEPLRGPSPGLRLTSAANETLLLSGQATPEALYGPGTRIFLEVAAQTVACTNPFSAARVCLQVRERRYDEKGLVVGLPGEWRPLYENIEGYTHQPGVRNVLRLKRFERNPAPAGASSTVLVLDLVVESEIVPK